MTTLEAWQTLPALMRGGVYLVLILALLNLVRKPR